MTRFISRGSLQHALVALFAVASMASSVRADPEGAARQEGWYWADQAPISPVTDVPTDGFVDLGLQLQGFGNCLSTLTPLDTVSVSVTDSVGAVPGTISINENLGRQTLRWTPESDFAAGATYKLTATADNDALGTDGCGVATNTVTKAGTFTTSAGVATGPPAAVTTLELSSQAMCEGSIFSVRFTYDGSPYVTYTAFDDAGPKTLNPIAGAGGFLTVDDVAADYCLTIRGTHALTGETTDTAACVADATTVPAGFCAPVLPADPAGCSAAGGTGGRALPAAFLLLFVVFGAVQRRLG